MVRAGAAVAMMSCLVGCAAIAGLDGDYSVGDGGTAGGGLGPGGSTASGSTTTSTGVGGTGVGGTTTGVGGTGGSPTGVGGGAPLGPFGAPQAIAALNSSSYQDDPTLTADMLEIYFDSNRPGGLGEGDIWMSSRASLVAPWSPPVNVVEINSASGETTPQVSADGLTIFLSSSRASGNADVFVATRASRSAPWSTPFIVAPLNSADGDYAVALTPDLLTLFMGSTRPGFGDFDLYSSQRSSVASPWSSPAAVVELDTAYVETDPWVNAASLVLYFTTDRPGGSGGWDIWTATRPTPSGTFGVPQPVAELNSASNDSDVWLSPDMRTAILSSDRSGTTELYVATR